MNSRSELAHYGVKGMKWGVRKSESTANDTPNSRYSQRKRSLDREVYGAKGEMRINRRMNAGKTHKQAERREFGRRLARSLAISGATSAIIIMDLYGKNPATYTAQRAETKRGQAAAAAAMGLPRTASSGPNYSKSNRKGVYNISSL